MTEAKVAPLPSWVHDEGESSDDEGKSSGEKAEGQSSGEKAEGQSSGEKAEGQSGCTGHRSVCAP